MKIGILQTGQAPAPLRELGAPDYPDLFRHLLAGRGFDFADWHVEGGEFPSSVHDAEAWLITGSRHGTYEDHPWIPRLEGFIRAARAAGVPMAGVCFGHQIMAQALGGRVEKFAGGWAVGPTEYRFGDDTLVLNAWHQDQVTAPPPGARTIASNDFCTHAAFSYGDWGLSVQAHPEFDADFVQGLIEHRGRGKVPDALLDAATAQADLPTDGARIADQLAAFFAKARAHAA